MRKAPPVLTLCWGLVRLRHSVGGAHAVVALPAEHGPPPASGNLRHASCSSCFSRSRQGITSRPPCPCAVPPLVPCIPSFPPFLCSTTHLLRCAFLCRYSDTVIWHGSSARVQMLSEVCTGASHVDLLQFFVTSASWPGPYFQHLLYISIPFVPPCACCLLSYVVFRTYVTYSSRSW